MVPLFLFFVHLGLDPSTKRSESGDFIGGHLGAAGSLAGTFFFLAALIMQSRDLRVQSQILEATIVEMKNSQEIAAEQGKTLRRQLETTESSALLTRFLDLVSMKDELKARETNLEMQAANLERNSRTMFVGISSEDYERTRTRVANIDYILEGLLRRTHLESMEEAHYRVLGGLPPMQPPFLEDAESR